MPPLARRTFLLSTAAGLAATSAAVPAFGTGEPTARPRSGLDREGDRHRGPAVIASGNGLRTVQRAMELMAGGTDPAVAIVEGVGIVEADPTDTSVGLGGLPNEDGVVQLDACVMHGPTHRAGAVAALEDTLHPAAVALRVLQTTDHVLLVGEGAKRFARAHGFPHQDLLTQESREAWLRWRNNRDANDDWLNDDQRDWGADGRAIPHTTGTIHCSAVNASGDLSGCTTTSGLSYKLAGRVGDSPIIGAGNYTDNEVGSAGATGRGEAVIESCGAAGVVAAMARGLTPTEACLEVLDRIARKSRLQKRLVTEAGVPNFNVALYAVRKDGAWGSAALLPGATFAVADSAGARVLVCEHVFG